MNAESTPRVLATPTNMLNNTLLPPMLHSPLLPLMLNLLSTPLHRLTLLAVCIDWHSWLTAPTKSADWLHRLTANWHTGWLTAPADSANWQNRLTLLTDCDYTDLICWLTTPYLTEPTYSSDWLIRLNLLTDYCNYCTVYYAWWILILLGRVPKKVPLSAII